jgi:pilus assembly protein CpaE
MNETLRVLCLSPDRNAAAAVVSALGALPGFSIKAGEADYQTGLRELQQIAVDLAIVVLGEQPALGVATIEELHRAAPATNVLALSAEENPEIIIKAMRAGADEFLPLPVPSTALLKVCIKVVEIRRASRPENTSRGEVWVVHGPKGGVGATTLTANLALALREANRGVAVVDFDVYQGDLALFLNVTPEYTLRDLVTNANRIDSLFLQGTLSRHPSGVEVLAAPPLVPGETILDATQDQALEILDLLCTMHEVVLVDTPAVLTPAAWAAMTRATRLFLLCDLTVPAVRAALRTIDWLRGENLDVERVLELVLNRHGKLAGEIPPAEVEKTLKLTARALLPLDDVAALSAVNSGGALKEARGGRGLAQAIAALVHRQTPGEHDAKKSGGLFGLFGGKARRG